MQATKWCEATPEQFAELEQALGPRPKYPPITDAQRRAELDADRVEREKRIERAHREAMATIKDLRSQYFGLEATMPPPLARRSEELYRIRKLIYKGYVDSDPIDVIKASKELKEAFADLDERLASWKQVQRYRAQQANVEVIEGWNI